jgi:pimeloyl-ACP methyl ester carboxylesterase
MSTGMHELTTRSRVVPMPLPLAKVAKPMATWIMAMPPPPGRVDGRLRTMTRYVTLSRQASDAEVDFSTRIINACPPETRAGFARMLAELDLDEQVARLDVPAIVVCGDRDRLTPIWHARRMSAALPRSLGLVTVPGAGHMTPVEAPRAIDHAVRRLAAAYLTPAPAPAPSPETTGTPTDEEIAR